MAAELSITWTAPESNARHQMTTLDAREPRWLRAAVQRGSVWRVGSQPARIESTGYASRSPNNIIPVAEAVGCGFRAGPVPASIRRLAVRAGPISSRFLSRSCWTVPGFPLKLSPGMQIRVPGHAPCGGAPPPTWLAAAPERSAWSALTIAFAGAFAVGVVMAWAVAQCWLPVFDAAVDHLPNSGQITNRMLHWQGDSPMVLAGNRFLAVVADLNFESELGYDADVCLTLGQRAFRVRSIAGYVEFPYPRAMPLNRLETKPWWQAWRQTLTLAPAVGIALLCLVVWCVLAIVVVAPGVLCLAWLAKRRLSFWGAAKLALTGFAFSAPLPAGAMALYAVNMLDLVRLLAVSGAQVPVAVICTCALALFRPRTPTSVANPFAAGRPCADASPTVTRSHTLGPAHPPHADKRNGPKEGP